MAKLAFEMSYESRLLSAYLLKAEIGKLLTYDDLSKVIDKPIVAARGSLQTARRHALREEGFVFGVERGIGIRRLTDDEKIAATVSQRTSIRNKAGRAAKELSTVDRECLSASRQLMATATMSIFLAIKAHVSDKSVQVLQVLGGSSKYLPIKETLEALLRSQEAS
jgi:hypothetical protein